MASSHQTATLQRQTRLRSWITSRNLINHLKHFGVYSVYHHKLTALRFSQQRTGVHTSGKPDGRDRPARETLLNGMHPKLEYEGLGRNHRADYRSDTQLLVCFCAERDVAATQRGVQTARSHSLTNAPEEVAAMICT